MNALKELVASLRSEKKELLLQLDDLLLDMEQMSELKGQAELEVEQLKEKLLEVNEELSVADNHIDDLEERMAAEKLQFEDQLADLREELAASKTAAEIAASFQAEMERDCSQELEELRAAHAAEMGRSEATCARLEGELRQMQSDKASLSVRLKDMEERLAEKDASIHAVDDKRVALVDLFDRATKDAAGLREEVASLQARLEASDRSAKQTEGTLRAALEECTATVQRLQQEGRDREVSVGTTWVRDHAVTSLLARRTCLRREQRRCNSVRFGARSRSRCSRQRWLVCPLSSLTKMQPWLLPSTDGLSYLYSMTNWSQTRWPSERKLQLWLFLSPRHLAVVMWTLAVWWRNCRGRRQKLRQVSLCSRDMRGGRV